MAKRFLICVLAVLASLAILACGTGNPMLAASDTPAPAAKAAGVVTPTNNFMFVWGAITLNSVPAPVGTVVEAVDGSGNLAGQFTVWYPGYYGAMAVYLDDPGTPVDEGAVVGEWLAIRVNGQPTGSKFQWTQFGDVVQVDLVVGTSVKTGSATIAGTATASVGTASAASGTKATTTTVKKRGGKR